MSKIIKSTFINKNSIGLISRITKDIFEENINILKSQMIRSNNLFVLRTECLLKDANIMNDITNKYSSDNLFDIVAQSDHPIDLEKVNISIDCADTPGIIHDSTKILSDMNIDIESLESDTDIAPLSGSHIFNMHMQINIPNGVTIDEINNNLDEITDKYGVNIIWGL